MPANKGLSRRNFLKLSSLAAFALPSVNLVSRIGQDEIVSSGEQYGSFLIRRWAKGDSPYEVDDAIYHRFNAKNNAFSRGIWDESFTSWLYNEYIHPFNIIAEDKPGLRREDYALESSSWTGAMFGGTDSSGSGRQRGLLDPKPLGTYQALDFYGVPWDGETSPQKNTEIIKKAALFLGASLVGIAETDERWIYSGYYNDWDGSEEGDIIFSESASEAEYQEDGTMVIPRSMNRVIALAFEMESDAFDTAASAISSAAAGVGYTKMGLTAGSLAEFIRSLGYNALPVGNQTAASVPIAIDAGLGELGRNGVLITPKYGPRVRLAKVFTDMPLEIDAPISFGVTQFCDVCGKCAENCPSGAISKEGRTFEANNISNNPGVKKWPLNAEKCYSYWMTLGYLDCGQCIRSCPFNKPEGWLHNITRILIGAESGPIDKLLLNLDTASGYGEQLNGDDWWQKDNYLHIK